MVQRGGFSTADFRDVFRNNIERRVRGLPDIEGLPKETVISSWMGKFDQIYRGDEDPRRQRQAAAVSSEAILSKEQLYDMFQNVLSVRKYEHQILYNAMQVSSHYYFAQIHCYDHHIHAKRFLISKNVAYCT
jgi:calcium-dependent secretion activator